MKTHLQQYLYHLALILALIVGALPGSAEVSGALPAAAGMEAKKITFSDVVAERDGGEVEGDWVGNFTKLAALADDLDPKTAARIAKGTELSDGFISVFKNDWGIPSPQFDQLKLDLAAGGIPLKKFFADEGESGLKAWEVCFKDVAKRVDIPWLTKLTESSGISKIDNANPLNVSWSNNIIGQNSSVSALDFWNDVSKNFLHYEQGDFIFKYDYNSGKLLLGNKASNKIIGFYEGLENVPIGVYELSPSNIVQKLKRYHGESGPSSPILICLTIIKSHQLQERQQP